MEKIHGIEDFGQTRESLIHGMDHKQKKSATDRQLQISSPTYSRWLCPISPGLFTTVSLLFMSAHVTGLGQELQISRLYINVYRYVYGTSRKLLTGHRKTCAKCTPHLLSYYCLAPGECGSFHVHNFWL